MSKLYIELRPAPRLYLSTPDAAELRKAKYTKRTGSPGNYKYEYGDDHEYSQPIKGMEGPFTYPSGRELYYDRSENGGSYYDRGQDRYLDQEEAEQAMRKACGFLYLDLQKSKYIKRTGSPGNYKYTYAKEGGGGGTVARKDAERAIWSIISPNDKSGRGKERKVLLTGKMAEVVGVPPNTSMKLADMSAEQLANAAGAGWKAPHYSRTPLHEESRAGGSYHVEDHGAGVNATYFTSKRGKKELIANAKDLESAKRHIERHANQDKAPPDRLGKLKEIVSNHSLGRIDGRAVDVQTAHAIVRTAEMLNDANREKFLKLPFGQMSELAWAATSKKSHDPLYLDLSKANPFKEPSQGQFMAGGAVGKNTTTDLSDTLADLMTGEELKKDE